MRQTFVTWDSKAGEAIGTLEQVIFNGAIPGIAKDIPLPAGLIEVWRDGKPSGDRVGVPIALLREKDNLPALEAPRTQSLTYPTTKQLEKINQWTTRGGTSREEVQVVNFIAADNLVNRGLSRWHLDEIHKMSKIFPGLPLMIDHNWDEVDACVGLVFDAKVEQLEPSSELLSRAGNGKYNREIVQKEGYWVTRVSAAIPSDHALLDKIRRGIVRFVSCGGFVHLDIFCPICDISFQDPKCPHVPAAFMGESDPEKGLIAPYYVRKDLIDMGELSVVSIPNLPGAEVVR